MRRRGFTLVEILVALAIGIILAAAFVPALVGTLDRSRVDETAASFDAIAEAVSSMHADVGRYPGRLAHLVSGVTATDLDACGNAYGAAASAWTGPYLERSVAATGLPLPLGLARDALTYTASPPVLGVLLDDVSHADARAINRKLDADVDSLAGAVRWGPVSAGGTVVLTLARPVRPC